MPGSDHRVEPQAHWMGQRLHTGLANSLPMNGSIVTSLSLETTSLANVTKALYHYYQPLSIASFMLEVSHHDHEGALLMYTKPQLKLTMQDN